MQMEEIVQEIRNAFENGDVADQMEWAARFLAAEVVNNPGEIRPSVVDDLALAFGEAGSVGWLDESAFLNCADWSPELMGQVMLQWIGKWLDEPNGRELQKAAVDVGDILGSDHAETLHQFAVACLRNS